jgi:hypothetical protein
MTRAPGAGWNQTEAGLGDHVLRGVGYLIGYPTKPGYRSRPKGSDKETRSTRIAFLRGCYSC